MKLETRFVLPLVFFAVARGVTTAAETTSPNLEDGLARCHAMVAAHDIEAAEFCASLLNESAYTLSSEQAVDVRFNLVDALSFSGDYSEALANLLAIQSSTKQFPDNQSLEYRWYRKRGLLHYRAGELVDAYEAYSKALRLAEITEDPVLLGKIDYLLDTGANDVMVIKATEASIDDRERLIPWVVDSVVSRIDTETGEVWVTWYVDA